MTVKQKGLLLPKVLPTEAEAQQRIGRLRETLINYLPYLSELLMWVPSYYEPDEELATQTYAYATSQKLYILPSFFVLPTVEQLAVIVHEVWHVALQHVQEASRLKAHPVISNIAMDVLINEGVKTLGNLRLPKGVVDVRWVEQVTCRKLDKEWQKYSWYELYLFLLKYMPRTDDPTKGISVDQSYFPPEDKKSQSEDGKPENLDGKNFNSDLKQEKDESVSEAEQRQWQSRLERTLAGDTTNNLRNSFSGLLPKPEEISWERLYSRYLTNWGLRYELDYSYSRLGRRYLAQTVPYVMPALVKQAGLLPVTVVFDTSGSIAIKELELFAATTDDFREKFDRELEMWVVMVDCEVQEVTKLPQGSTLKQYLKANKAHFAGRGGTSFIPGLQKARELGTKLCVYFTDLEGQAGQQPKGIDVLWIAVGKAPNPPFGKVLRIETN